MNRGCCNKVAERDKGRGIGRERERVRERERERDTEGAWERVGFGQAE